MIKKYCDLCGHEIKGEPKYLNISSGENKPLIQEREICAWCVIGINTFLNTGEGVRALAEETQRHKYEKTEESTDIQTDSND